MIGLGLRFGWVLLAFLGVACAGEQPAAVDGAVVAPPACEDSDGDGYGANCELGADCNDHRAEIFEGCTDCLEPAEGCVCEQGASPVTCYLQVTDEEGELTCHEGTRYCREGLWSGCEDVLSYALPVARQTFALVDPDLEPVTCNVCNPVCFRVSDPLNPDQGSLGGTSNDRVSWGANGGLTLATDPEAVPADAGVAAEDDAAEEECVIGTGDDGDCDGIPDIYDPYPLAAPFETSNEAIFLELGPGDVGSGDIDLLFGLNSADVYFLVDQSGSMGGERDQLVADLLNGSFLADPDYQCADYDRDGVPDNEVKTGGITGAIRCIIRDSRFGVGLFRELPFSGYAPTTQIPFSHYQDITNDVSLLASGVNRLAVEGNYEWPEASMVALHSVVSGTGLDLGIAYHGAPDRTDCPAGTWGYPCFREGAIPIVLLFTDAMLHNGPAANNYPYPSSFQTLVGTTPETYVQLTSDNEDFESAYALGDLGERFVSVLGDTYSMASDVDQTQMSCLDPASDTARDAFVRFELTETKNVTFYSAASMMPHAVGVYRVQQPEPTALSAAGSSNDSVSSAYDLGSLSGASVSVVGDTTGMAGNYTGSGLGCSAEGLAGDAVYQLTVDAPTRVAFSTENSALNTVIGLYDEAPQPLLYTPNASDDNTALQDAPSLGDAYDAVLGVSGDSSAASLTASYPGTALCGAYDEAIDVAYRFDLSQPTRVQLSTEGSAIDTVVALVSESCPSGSCGVLGERSVTVSSTAEGYADAVNLGALDGQVVLASGSTAGMAADLVGLACAADTAEDAFVSFELGASRDISLSATAAFDYSLALYTTRAGGIEEPAAQQAENTDAPQSLGGLNGKNIRVQDAYTTGLFSDYDAQQLSCAPDTAGSGDAAFHFRLDSPTTVRVDARGADFEPALSLHDAPIELPVQYQSYAPGTSAEHPASAYVVSDDLTQTIVTLNGSIVDMSADLQFHGTSSSLCHAGADAEGADTVIQFEVNETGNYRLDLQSDFSHALALYPQPPSPYEVPTQQNASAGRDSSAPVELGLMDDRWIRASGETTRNDIYVSSCGASSRASDVFYRFTLTETQTLTFSSEGSGIDSVLVLEQYLDVANDQTVQLGCDSESGSGDDGLLTRTLAAGTYRVLITSESRRDEGHYALEIKAASQGSDNLLACTGGTTSSSLVQNLAAGTYYAVVKGYDSASAGSYALTLRESSLALSSGDAHMIACDAGSLPSASRLERTLPAGDYYVVVSGISATDEGYYELTLTDLGDPPWGQPAAPCVNNGPLTVSDLPAGTYWAAFKGLAPGQAGEFTLAVQDDAAVVGQVLACDADSLGGGAAQLELDLDAGTYYAVVKGQHAGDAGEYRLAVRDVARQPGTALSCAASGAQGAALLEADLEAGVPYYVVVRGQDQGATGAYSLRVTDTTLQEPVEHACVFEPTSSWTRSLDAGTYYVTVKGSRSWRRGEFLLALGAGGVTTGSYSPPTWQTTLDALQARGVRVMSVISCQDDPGHGNGGDCDRVRSQAQALANATDTLGENLAPLVYDINSDGDGLSSQVVEGIVSLSDHLEMDVRAQVVFDPDANPGFVVQVEAVDVAGDGCSGIAEGTEHLGCRPGATPKFVVTFENPEADPVLPNPDDPNGGYNFRAVLIGDDSFVIDEVPIYIIPEDIIPDPGDPIYYSSGEYWQDLDSDGCQGNQRPDWRDLTWSVSVPDGTEVEFLACTAETLADLGSCEPKLIARITGGPTCGEDADCATGAICDPSVHACQAVTSIACSQDATCPSNASCLSGRCTFDSQPIYVGDRLGVENYQSFLRMTIRLTGEAPVLDPPIVNYWDLTYLCADVN